jgi:hypothetical protein
MQGDNHFESGKTCDDTEINATRPSQIEKLSAFLELERGSGYENIELNR